MAFSAPVEDLEVKGGFEAPEDDLRQAQDNGQSRLSSAASGTAKAAGQFFTRGLQGVGRAVSALSPINYLPKMGITAPKVDETSALSRWMGDPGKQITAIGKAGGESLERALPTNPAFANEFWAGQAPEALGQVMGLLGETVATRGANTIPLIHSGLAALASGYDEADRQGVTDQNSRDAMALSYGLSEALVERLGGVGSKAFGKRLFDATARKGGESFVKRFAKTALTEGVEEPITGELQDISANIFGNENAPEWDPTDPDVLKRRATEFALGAVMGAPIGAIDAIASRRTEPAPTGLDGPPRLEASDQEVEAAYQEAYPERIGPPVAGGFSATKEDLAAVSPSELRLQRDRLRASLRDMSNEELAESIAQAEALATEPEWQEVSQQLKAEAVRRADQKLTNRQDFQDDGIPKGELQLPDGTPIIPQLPELRTKGGFVEPPSEAELSAQAIDAALAEEERIKQSPVGAQGLTEDLAQREQESRMLMEQGIPGLEGMYSRTPQGWMHNVSPARPTSEQMNLFLEEEYLRRNPGQKTILSESITGPAQQTPVEAISSPSEASSPSSAVPTLGEPQSAPEAKETPKAALPAAEALDAVADAENALRTAQGLTVSPSIIQHLRNRLTAAQKAKMEVTLPNGAKAVVPAVVKGPNGVEPNEAPAAMVAAEQAKAENARLAAEKAKQEAEKEKEKAKAEKEKVQSTEAVATNVESKEETDHDHAVKQLKGKKVSLTKLEDGEEVTKKGLDAQDEYQKNLKREVWLTQLLNCLKS